MNSPNHHDAKVQRVATNVNQPPQYYSRGQPIPRAGAGCGALAPAAYNGTPERLAQFAYPCRPCCPSIYDVTNPGNRKGGEYYHMLSDVHHYDYDGYNFAWWGSAQRCAANCGWQQGLPAKDRPPFATQPALNLRRDYESMAPDHSHRTYPPNYTTAPLPGAPPCVGRRQSCGCPHNVPPIASTQGAQCPQPYLNYYADAQTGDVGDSGASHLNSQYAWWTHELVQVLRARRGDQYAEGEAAQKRLLRTHRQLGATLRNERLVGVLDELSNRLVALVNAHAQNDGKAYAAARTRLYEQGDLVATTQNPTKTLQNAWRAYLRHVIEQVEVQDANEALDVFDRAHVRARALFATS